MKIPLWMLCSFLGSVVVGCSPLGGSRASDAPGGSPAAVLTTEDDGEDEEIEVSLSAVPQAAKDAALAAVPGFVIAKAEMETENGTTVYCLQGTASGKNVEVDVTASGQVLEVESEDDDD